MKAYDQMTAWQQGYYSVTRSELPQTNPYKYGTTEWNDWACGRRLKMEEDKEPELFTVAEYATLTPYQQGFYTYMQANWPGSEIPKFNPYSVGSPEEEKWNDGNFRAMLNVQDGEE